MLFHIVTVLFLWENQHLMKPPSLQIPPRWFTVLHCKMNSPPVCQTFHHSRHSVACIGETRFTGECTGEGEINASPFCSAEAFSGRCSVTAPAIHRIDH